MLFRRRVSRSGCPGRLPAMRRFRLSCPAALPAIARGGHRAQRAFCAGEAIAAEAGYRSCAVCLPGALRAVKQRQDTGRRAR
jgi:hypothetical protein